MFKKIVLLLLSAWVLLSLWADLSFAAFEAPQPVSDTIIWTDANLYTTIQNWVTFFIGFLYFVAVVFWLWGWFNILTSSWDEEKVKKWKNIIIYAVIWIIIIFLASSIIDFVFNTVNNIDEWSTTVTDWTSARQN